jgi:hypothetical protein
LDEGNPPAYDKDDMANYGEITRFKLIPIEGWLSSRGSKLTGAFQMDGVPNIGSSGVSFSMEIGPVRMLEMIHPPSPSYLRYNVERYVAKVIDRSFMSVVLSACDGTTDVEDVSEIISIESRRLAECDGGTICSTPSIGLYRAVFMPNWGLVITGHVPHGHAIRIDKGRCWVIPRGWPRVDRMASYLMDGGTMMFEICIEEVSAVARYGFVGG